jgi:hypothetical protein
VLRKLFEQYPEAFASVMDDVMRNGKHWPKLLPPRSAKRIGRDTHAAPLADYRNARSLGWSRLDLFKKHADDGCQWGGVYHGGTWASPDAVREQLKTAERSTTPGCLHASVTYCGISIAD